MYGSCERYFSLVRTLNRRQSKSPLVFLRQPPKEINNSGTYDSVDAYHVSCYQKKVNIMDSAKCAHNFAQFGAIFGYVYGI